MKIISRKVGHRKAWFLTFVSVSTLCTAILTMSSVNAEVFPSGGRAYKDISQGETVRVRWSNEINAHLVDVLLWDGRTGVYTMIAEKIPISNHQIEWQVPESIPNGDRFRFVIRDVANHHRRDYSSGFVHIQRSQEMIVGVGGVVSTSSVMVWPNPANQVCEIRWHSGLVDKIKVTDLQGNITTILSVERGSQAAVLDVSGFSKGAYQISLMQSDVLTGVAPLHISSSP
jgi:hypothetical protein